VSTFAFPSMPIKAKPNPDWSSLDPVQVKRGRLGDTRPSDPSTPLRIFYEHPRGHLVTGDAIAWLNQLDAASVDLIVADPPYNLQKAKWDRFATEEAYLTWSLEWIAAARRVLKETGSLYVCGFSETLADLKRPALRWFADCRWLVWHYRNKANLGRDWGRSHESILHLRVTPAFRLRLDAVRVPYGRHTVKYPARTQARTSCFGDGRSRAPWVPHPAGAKPRDVLEYPTTCNGMGERTPHPSQKPEGLIRHLILAASDEHDLVIDPFSGSGTTVVAAQQLNRRWIGCDREPSYHAWAVRRLETLPNRSIADWLDHDRRAASHRDGIR